MPRSRSKYSSTAVLVPTSSTTSTHLSPCRSCTLSSILICMSAASASSWPSCPTTTGSSAKKVRLCQGNWRQKACLTRRSCLRDLLEKIGEDQHEAARSRYRGDGARGWICNTRATLSGCTNYHRVRMGDKDALRIDSQDRAGPAFLLQNSSGPLGAERLSRSLA